MTAVTKTFYFVRHGSTPHLESDVYQDLHIPLSEKGLKQVEFVAKRFRAIPIDVIFSSDMERARQTAKAIHIETGCLVVESSILHERIYPSSVRGRSKKDAEVVDIMQKVDDVFAGAGHHSDEENFLDLKSRAIEALALLEECVEQNICVIAHASFLHVLIGVMMEGESASLETFRKFQTFLRTSNTGITKCMFDNGKWHLVTWNDDAHLGIL